MHNASPASDTASPAMPSRPPTGRRWPARIAVFGTILLVAAMLAFLCVRWYRVKEPTSVILVVGDPSLEGAQVLVTPGEENEMRGKPVSAALTAAEQFRAPVFCLPGRYQVTVTWRRHLGNETRADVLWNSPVATQRLRVAVIDLPTTLTVLGDDSLSEARVDLSSAEGTASARLTKQSNYQLTFLCRPGQYILEVTRLGGQPLAQDVLILAHSPKQIDLRQKE